MKINLTKKQYERLIRLMFVGDFVVNGYKDEEDEDYVELLQYFYSFAKEMDKENLIEYDNKYKRYFETRDFEEEIMPLIEEYEETSFMDEFVNKVSNIAFRNKYGDDQSEIISDEVINKMEDIRERVLGYLDDEGFEKAVKNILDNVK